MHKTTSMIKVLFHICNCYTTLEQDIRIFTDAQTSSHFKRFSHIIKLKNDLSFSPVIDEDTTNTIIQILNYGGLAEKV